MKRVVDQSVSPGGDLDALLGAYFKREMPRPWPAFQRPRIGRRTLPLKPKPTPRFVFSSRMALAASVALLLLCGWLLSGKFPGPIAGPGGATLTDPSATHQRPSGPPLLPDTVPDSKPAPGKVKSNLILEQGKDGTSVRIDVEEVPPRK
jgi:hypothetical protein